MRTPSPTYKSKISSKKKQSVSFKNIASTSDNKFQPLQDEKPKSKKSSQSKKECLEVLAEKSAHNSDRKESWIRDLTFELDRVSTGEQEKENLHKI